MEPNFGLSGVLAAETNMVVGVPGVVLVYNEPPEAAKATLRWRLYTFKNGEHSGEERYLRMAALQSYGDWDSRGRVENNVLNCSRDACWQSLISKEAFAES